MSKSKGNVVSPASIVERLGADTARCYILFVGPPDQEAEWSDEGVEGVHRFLGGCGGWRPRPPNGRHRGRVDGAAAAQGDDGAPAQGPLGDRQGERRPAALRVQHRDRGGDGAVERMLAAARVRDIETLRFALGTAASLLFPFAPHVGADIYERLTGERVWEQPWPRGRSRSCSRATPTSWSVRSTARSAIVCRRGGGERRRAQGAVPARAQRAGAPRRQGDRQGDRRARQARQHRRAIAAGPQAPRLRRDGRAEARLPDPRRRSRGDRRAPRRAARARGKRGRRRGERRAARGRRGARRPARPRRSRR